MKKIYCYLIVLVLGLYSCETDEIDTYDAGNYLQFYMDTWVDTVDISFLMLGDPATYDYPVVIRHFGMPAETEFKPFIMKVVDTASHIKAGMYTLPECSFQPWSKLDTFYVKLTNYPELEGTKAILCLELQSNEYFTVGDRDYRRLYMRIHNDVSKPTWWDSNTQRYLLGDYSNAKYRALIRALQDRLGEVDFSNTTWNNKRIWALEFKEWLQDHPEKEESGELITVPVVE